MAQGPSCNSCCVKWHKAQATIAPSDTRSTPLAVRPLKFGDLDEAHLILKNSLFFKGVEQSDRPSSMAHLALSRPAASAGPYKQAPPRARSHGYLYRPLDPGPLHQPFDSAASLGKANDMSAAWGGDHKKALAKSARPKSAPMIKPRIIDGASTITVLHAPVLTGSGARATTMHRRPAGGLAVWKGGTTSAAALPRQEPALRARPHSAAVLVPRSHGQQNAGDARMEPDAKQGLHPGAARFAGCLALEADTGSEEVAELS